MPKAGTSNSHLRKSRLQSSVEYIFAYGIVVLILVIVIGIFFNIFSTSKGVVPTSCQFSLAISCPDIILATNTVTSNTELSLLLVNSGTYALANPQMVVNLKSLNSSPSNCLPNYVKPGGAIICLLKLPQKTSVKEFVSGNLYLSANQCGLSTSGTCVGAPIEIYSGAFHGSTQPSETLGVSISLIAASNQISVNQKDPLTATAMFYSTPFQGITVNFSTNTISAALDHNYINTNTAGQAFDTVSSGRPGNIKVYANISGNGIQISSNVIITVTGASTTTTTSIATSTTAASTTTSSSTTTILSSTSTSSSTTTSTTTTINNPCIGLIGVGAWTSTTNYPTPISATLPQSCTSYNGYIYCVGLDSTFSNTVAYALISANGIGTWAYSRSYPIESAVYCTSYNGYIYCLSSGVNNVYYAPLSSSGVSAWTRTTNYPTNSGPSCTSYNGYIYCVGGYSGSYLNTAYYAPISSSGVGAWVSTTHYPKPVQSNSCISANGHIYCVGGATGGTGFSSDLNNVYYAPISSAGIGAWTAAPSYPFSGEQSSCVSSSNNIYCVDGFNGNTNSASNSVYYATIDSNGVLGAWASTTSYPRTMLQNSCTSSGTDVYCVGGWTGGPSGISYYAPLCSLPPSTTTSTSSSTTTIHTTTTSIHTTTTTTIRTTSTSIHTTSTTSSSTTSTTGTIFYQSAGSSGPIDASYLYSTQEYGTSPPVYDNYFQYSGDVIVNCPPDPYGPAGYYGTPVSGSCGSGGYCTGSATNGGAFGPGWDCSVFYNAAPVFSIGSPQTYLNAVYYSCSVTCEYG